MVFKIELTGAKRQCKCHPGKYERSPWNDSGVKKSAIKEEEDISPQNQGFAK